MKSKKQQQLYHESEYIEDTSDEEQAPTMSVPKAFHSSNKPKRLTPKSLASEAEHTIAMRTKMKPKPKLVKKQFTLDPQKVFDAFHEASTKVEILDVYLSQIEKTQSVAQWLQANQSDDMNYAENLLQKISTIAAILNTTEKTDNTSASGQTRSVSAAMSQYFTLRAPFRSIMLLAPVEIFKGLQNYSSKKVLGFVRRRNSDQFPEKVAFPGWTTCMEPHPKLLDSDLWTREVLRFAEIYGYKFLKGSFDDRNRVPVGTTYASHVEPKLMLYIACMELEKITGKEYHLGMLYKLKRSTMQAEIVISEEPCQNCKLFQNMLEELIGLKYIIKLAPNLGRLKPKRDNHGNRYYDVEVSDESESDELLQLQGGIEPRGGQLEIQIVTKSSSKKKQTVLQRSSGKSMASKLAPVKQSYDGIPSPPKTPRKNNPLQSMSRRRICYDKADWESDYVPPGPKLPKSPKRYMLHTQDDLEALDRTEQRFQKRMKVSETWLYRN